MRRVLRIAGLLAGVLTAAALALPFAGQAHDAGAWLALSGAACLLEQAPREDAPRIHSVV